MTSYKSLAEYQDLLKRVSLHGGRTIAFIGSGLSRPIGLPTWAELRDKIIADFIEEAQTRADDEKARITTKCVSAKALPSLWHSFDILSQIRGQAAFEQAIKRHLSPAERNQPPANYQKVWKADVQGIITLNVDGFSQKSFSQLHPGADLNIFNGGEISNYADAISREQPFVCNLHGILGNPSSWVFTTKDRERLIKVPGFKDFFASCFLGTTVVFIGITAEDVAAGGILENLVHKIGISFAGDHYWVTDRSDGAAADFSDAIGLKRIKYSTEDNHKELELLLDELAKKDYNPPPPSVIIPPGTKSRNYSTPDVQSVLALGNPNSIRKELNQIASNILRTSSPDKDRKYGKFVADYDQAIHSAWYIPRTGKTDFFDYKIERLISSEGAFGAVYEAKNSSGKCYAIKILHEAIRDNADMQDAFRRGVSSMKILSKRGFSDVVNIVGAWEMPAALAMEFVDGLNLQAALETHCLDSWEDKLRVCSQLARILLKAHRLPEVVVHRDVRPPNVMLKDFYQKGDPIDLVLIDFDLSWHRDAMGKSVQLTPSIHGYLAPEQYESSVSNTSRSSLVDSFGLAMTIYFIVLGQHPKFEEPRRADWEVTLFRNFRLVKSDRWLAIPCRLARLVFKGTLLDQSVRVDMTTMVIELENLLTLCESDVFSNIRILIEEIALRSAMLKDRYQWDEASGSASYEGATGLLVEVKMLSGGSLRMIAEWKNQGDGKFETVKKYFQQRKDGIASRLKSSGWHVEIFGNYDGIRVSADKDINIRKIDKTAISSLAADLDYLIDAVNYRGA
jgi:eukaryotic-like serine/threonine-protein kinase